MSPGLDVAEIFRRHGDAYRQARAGHLGRTERRILRAISVCRTAALGGYAEYCKDCGLVRCAIESRRYRKPRAIRPAGLPPPTSGSSFGAFSQLRAEGAPTSSRSACASRSGRTVGTTLPTFALGPTARAC